jgi:hypothetical protein
VVLTLVGSNKVGVVRLRKVRFFREILFIYNYLGLKRTLALRSEKSQQNQVTQKFPTHVFPKYIGFEIFLNLSKNVTEIE